MQSKVYVTPASRCGGGVAFLLLPALGGARVTDGWSVWTADSSLLFIRSERSASAGRLYPGGLKIGLAAGLVLCGILGSRTSFFVD